MTFAEILLIIVVGAGLYFLMTPLQRRLEWRLTKFFRANSSSNQKPIIDITDYKKTQNQNKEKPKS